MKIATLSVGALLIAMTLGSCAGNGDKGGDQNVAAVSTGDSTLTGGIRYYSLDSVMANYNLAKDYDEASLRLQRNIESTTQSRSSAIEKFGTQMQTKMNGGQYTSEAQAQADYQKFQKMQADAQTEIGRMQQNAMMQVQNMQKEVSDSLAAVLKDLGAAHNLQAILPASPTQYFAPSLDITQAVIDELNSRYTKVATDDKKD